MEFENEIGYADNVNLELEETDYLDPEDNYFDVVQFRAMVSKDSGKKMIRSGFWVYLWKFLNSEGGGGWGVGF